MHIIISAGISGSGKSTEMEKFLRQHTDYICINRDSLRMALVKNLHGYYQRKDLNQLESIVNDLTDAILTNAEAKNYNVVVDNTNLKMKYINQFINYPGCKSFEFRLFYCEPEVAKARVLKRDFSNYIDNSNKADYIDKQYKDFIEIEKHIKQNYADKLCIEQPF